MRQRDPEPAAAQTSGAVPGLRQTAPTFAVSVVLSMAGLAYAMRDLRSGRRTPGGSGSAPLAVGFGMATGAEAVTVVKVLQVVGIIACVAGLQYLHGSTPSNGGHEVQVWQGNPRHP